MIGRAFVAAFGAFFAPLVGILGVSHLVHRAWKPGLLRLGAGLAIAFLVLEAYFGHEQLLLELAGGLVAAIVLLLLLMAAYLALWVEGVAHAVRRFPRA